MQVFRVVSAALIAAVFSATLLAAQPLAKVSGPREQPPANYSANQYVDSAGCVFMRAGVGDAVSWVPRVSRDRRLVCGYPPSLPAAAAAAPTPEPVVPEAIAAPADAPADVPAPAAKSPAAKPLAAAPAAAAAKAPEPAPAAAPAAVRSAIAAPPARAGAPAVTSAPTATKGAARLVQIRAIAGRATYCPDPGPSAQRFLLSDGRRVTRCGAPVADALGYLNGLGAPGLSVEAGRASVREERRALAADAGDYRVVWASGELATRSTIAAPAATARAAARGDAAGPAAAGPYYVQAGAFAVPANADATVARLRALDLPVASAADRVGARPVRIILAGPFTTIAAASEARARLRGAGYPNAYLRR